jgi:hypothetical protein
MERKHWPRLAYNWVSVTGAAISLVVGLTIFFLLVVTLLSRTTNPYLGVLLYLVLPSFLVTSLLLIPVGMYFRWRALLKGRRLHPHRWPSVDLNNPRHRNAAFVFIFGTILFLVLSSVGVYRAYQYTDSVAFCGLVCHKVMVPEYITYHDSPHARVKCVDCHIGPGAGWYAKSKLSGLYQVYATVAGRYPRPIPTPIKDLRPLQEECDQCHWPQQFFGAQQREFIHYLYDKGNTYWPINMLINTGGGNPGAAQASGIHWHMNIAVKVEYKARDRQKQDIPWVKVTDRLTGEVKIYEDTSRPFTKDELETAELRVMDCIDCHNRPSHAFRSPDHEVDLAIYTRRIDPAIPDIKKVAVDAMSAQYGSDEAAMDGIASAITGYFRIKYPGLYSQNGKEIANAVRETRAAFARNIFPEMRAKWSLYPDNIGHFIFRGCMRCHDGNHKDSAGSAITNDCHACHVIISQGGGGPASALDLKTGLDFVHPVDIGDAWKGGICYECHNGVQPI